MKPRKYKALKTAADLNMAYDARMAEVTRLLREFVKQLDKHHTRQRRNSDEPAFIQELDEVKDDLSGLMRKLG